MKKTIFLIYSYNRYSKNHTIQIANLEISELAFFLVNIENFNIVILYFTMFIYFNHLYLFLTHWCFYRWCRYNNMFMSMDKHIYYSLKFSFLQQCCE